MAHCNNVVFSPGSFSEVSPAVFQYSFCSTLQQLVELQLELLPLRLFGVSSRTVDIDYSNSLYFVLTPVEVKGQSRRAIYKK